ncbi:Hypothetical protein, putative [Bodo saltans]|uniref:Uncharacterized protein n=1 Tax=Bodo saltans TaxID=75058 RepID=A0A0S4IN84_BODSA|nr:Hypothetical protein, putative [Bodo saltans]|eukprot:CUF62743.1 Hypothetical protein, putative [Bodo saltans]
MKKKICQHADAEEQANTEHLLSYRGCTRVSTCNACCNPTHTHTHTPFLCYRPLLLLFGLQASVHRGMCVCWMPLLCSLACCNPTHTCTSSFSVFKRPFIAACVCVLDATTVLSCLLQPNTHMHMHTPFFLLTPPPPFPVTAIPSFPSLQHIYISR